MSEDRGKEAPRLCDFCPARLLRPEARAPGFPGLRRVWSFPRERRATQALTLLCCHRSLLTSTASVEPWKGFKDKCENNNMIIDDKLMLLTDSGG